MRSINRSFNKLVRENPCKGLTVLFKQAIRGKNYTEKMISENFNHLVQPIEPLTAEDKKRFMTDCALATKPHQDG